MRGPFDLHKSGGAINIGVADDDTPCLRIDENGLSFPGEIPEDERCARIIKTLRTMWDGGLEFGGRDRG